MELLKTLVCPRCHSGNTKFCYYNNYTKSQPRHYCRSCKKHWTEGGTLRDVPAGSRAVKKRHRSSKTASKSMFCKTVPTSRSGCKTQAIVRSDENLDLKADDTQLVVQQKDESFGGISSGCGKKETLFECYDVLTDDDIVPLELFSFELPEVSDLMVTGQNEAEDRQQWQWRVPNSTSDNVSMDLGWEDHHQNDLFFASDILSMDVPELMQP